MIERQRPDQRIARDEEQGVERAADPAGGLVERRAPFPGHEAVAEDVPVGDLEGLVELVGLEERPAQKRVEQPEEPQPSEQFEGSAHRFGENF